MSAYAHEMCVKVALFVCAGVYTRIKMCAGACMCECVAAVCVGIATLVYSCVMCDIMPHA